MTFEPLTDLEWEVIGALFPVPLRRMRGKPHAPWRAVANSILHVLVSGGKWGLLPKEGAFASKSSANRWFIEWAKTGFLESLVNAYRQVKGSHCLVTLPPRRQRGPRVKPEELLEPAIA